ncbi:NTF2-related export protein [Lachnellula hyalina]|uniref:NTF2-related export protein n=1 Tax=Lachnellula hyalina TaxID=1316788 RepID=A0A8H8R2F9_9HELO|nr:NTF2-related export protein [Lachnellula hyalina]TVY27179.1 NTF2-related export protein [Lachnellula hyalina]
MTDISENTEVKVAVEAAEIFVNSYYKTWNKESGGKELSHFYVKVNPESPLKPDITINGNIVEDPTDLEGLHRSQPSKTHYEVEAFDCQVVNTNFTVGAPETLLEGNPAGKKMSILVMVSGSVKYADAEETRGFVDNVLLVPNWDITKKNEKEKKKWLVQSQTFRLKNQRSFDNTDHMLEDRNYARSREGSRKKLSVKKYGPGIPPNSLQESILLSKHHQPICEVARAPT